MNMLQSLYVDKKAERNTYLTNLSDNFITQHAQDIEEANIPNKVIDYIFDAL